MGSECCLIRWFACTYILSFGIWLLQLLFLYWFLPISLTGCYSLIYSLLFVAAICELFIDPNVLACSCNHNNRAKLLFELWTRWVLHSHSNNAIFLDFRWLLIRFLQGPPSFCEHRLYHKLMSTMKMYWEPGRRMLKKLITLDSGAILQVVDEWLHYIQALSIFKAISTVNNHKI